MLLGVELVIHDAALRLPQALDDDLFAVAGGNPSELHIIHGDADNVAHLILCGDSPRLVQRHFVEGVDVVLFLHHVLLYKHPQRLMLIIHVHNNVLHALVVPLVGSGQRLNDLLHHKGSGNVALLLQQSQGGKNLRAVHAGRFLLLLASHFG